MPTNYCNVDFQFKKNSEITLKSKSINHQNNKISLPSENSLDPFASLASEEQQPDFTQRKEPKQAEERRIQILESQQKLKTIITYSLP